MVRAYYLSGTSQHQELSMEEVESATGALYCKVSLDKFDGDVSLEDIKQRTGYNFDQVCHYSDKLLHVKEYRNMVTEFRKEHMHLEHEIRCVVDGTTSFDIRDVNDEWVQVTLTPGDLLILPAGVYHRLSLHQELSNAKVVRLFKHRLTRRLFHRPGLEHKVNFRVR